MWEGVQELGERRRSVRPRAQVEEPAGGLARCPRAQRRRPLTAGSYLESC